MNSLFARLDGFVGLFGGQERSASLGEMSLLVGTCHKSSWTLKAKEDRSIKVNASVIVCLAQLVGEKITNRMEWTQ